MPSATDPSVSAPRATRRAWTVVALWLAGTAAAFWYFTQQQLQPFETELPGQVFDATERARSAEQWLLASYGAAPREARATVVELPLAACRCSSLTAPHVARMRADYAPRGVRFLRAAPVQPGNPDPLPWVRSGPAAMVFDSAGRLVYYGPYSAGASCGTTDGLVEKVLERLLAGNEVQLRPATTRGCYCASS
jgi:hypothetical protein